MHELEFLSLLAFLAREAISSKHSNFSKAKKFSPNDLEMAYAFHSKFGTGHTPQQPPFQGPNFDGQQKHQSPPHQKHQSPPHPHYRVDTSPQHVLNMSGQHFQQPQPLQQGAHSSGHGQMGQSAFHAPHMPMRNYPGHGESLGEQQLQNRYEVPGHGASMLHQSARYSGQVLGPSGQQQTERDDQRMNMLLAANEHQQRGSHYSSPHGVTDDKKMMPMHLYPQERPPQVGGDMLDASRTSGEQQFIQSKHKMGYPMFFMSCSVLRGECRFKMLPSEAGNVALCTHQSDCFSLRLPRSLNKYKPKRQEKNKQINKQTNNPSRALQTTKFPLRDTNYHQEEGAFVVLFVC